jgi:hypothetical protein
MDRMRILTRNGVEFVEVQSEREASIVGSYWNAVRRYVHTGDDIGLAALDTLSVAERDLETDVDWIDYWAVRGELEFEDIYEGG